MDGPCDRSVIARMERMRRPVLKLRLALSGVYWEQSCRTRLLELGFEDVPKWEQCFVRQALVSPLSNLTTSRCPAPPTLSRRGRIRYEQISILTNQRTWQQIGCGHTTLALCWQCSNDCGLEGNVRSEARRRKARRGQAMELPQESTKCMSSSISAWNDISRSSALAGPLAASGADTGG